MIPGTSCPQFMDIWRGLLGVIYVPKVATGLSRGFQPGFNPGNPQRNEFALKGPEADLIKLAPIATPKLACN
jgi:hypothetical protein